MFFDYVDGGGVPAVFLKGHKTSRPKWLFPPQVDGYSICIRVYRVALVPGTQRYLAGKKRRREKNKMYLGLSSLRGKRDYAFWTFA